MKKRTPARRALALLAIPLAAIALLSGCERTTPSETPPDADVAASFAASAQSAATVNENLQLAQLFANPMASATGDLGLAEDPEFDPWTGQGVDFPQLALVNAQAFRAAAALQVTAARSARAGRKATAALPAYDAGPGFDRAEGDTLSVEYFNSADSTGLNAVIEAAGQDMVRFVAIRDYPNAILWQVSHRESEVLIDTNGTLADPEDDSYHRLSIGETLANGQVSSGLIQPVAGPGPIGPDTLVEADLRVDDPSFHPFQAWIETVVRMEIGALDTEGDEVFHRLANTVHWKSGAEQTAVIEAAGGGAIVNGSEVTLTATFTAAPGNPWLESVEDHIRANLGELEDEGDDLLLEIGRVSTFDGQTAEGDSPSATVTFTPEDPVGVGEEPCGGNFEEEIFYAAGWWLQHAQRQVEISCAGAGSYHLHLDFLDGSSLDRTITWDGAGAATLTESRPDGVSVEGEFNESSGEYSVITTFAAGSDPVSREQTGTILPGSLAARDEFFWQDDHADYRTFTATETAEGWTATGQHVKGGLTETFSVTGTASTLTGEWSRTAAGVNASGEYTLEALDAGGAHLVFSARDTLAEGNPSAVGDFWYAADGSGHGTLVYTQFGHTVTYNVSWTGDGAGTLSDGQGNTIPLG